MNKKTKRKLGRKVNLLASRTLEMLNYLPGLDRIETVSVPIVSEKIPEAFDKVTIVFVTDLHAHRFGAQQQRLSEAVQRIRPDLILSGGDWVRAHYRGKDKQRIDEAVKGLSKIAPLVGIFGNHEAKLKQSEEFQHSLEAQGVLFLRNETIRVQKDGQAIELTGFDTPYHLYRDGESGTKKRAQLRRLVYCYRGAVRNKAPWRVDLNKKRVRIDLSDENSQNKRPYSENAKNEELFRIALGHRPEIVDLYAKCGVDLVLSGHAHGGLMKIPAGKRGSEEKRLLAPGQGWFPKYTHGTVRRTTAENTMTEVISEGLGGPRILIFPKLVKVTLHKKVTERKHEL